MIVIILLWLVIGYLSIARLNAFNVWVNDYNPDGFKERIIILSYIFIFGILSLPVGLAYYRRKKQKLFDFNFKNRVKWF